jgi:ectoine hydroxylase-related dioxygenase (phytanoyl-CoA dioxygenase family)
VVLAAEEVSRFWNDGFLAIADLVDEQVVARLRVAYDEIIGGQLASPTDRLLGGITRQVMVPSMVHPVFDDNEALAAGRAVMRDLFGCAHANRTYDMLIDKPAGHPHETPWHQDAGYVKLPTAPAGFTMPLTSVQFWLALDDVDVDNGCMQFVPGMHRSGTWAHTVVAGHPEDEGRLIAFTDPNEAQPERAVPCPLAAGGATAHTVMTPHYTGPNRTADRPRRAYIFNLLAADVHDVELQDSVRQSYVANIAASRSRGLAERPRTAKQPSMPS